MSTPASRHLGMSLTVAAGLVAAAAGGAIPVAAAAPAPGASPAAVTTTAVRTYPGTSCPVFPADNYWHAPVSKLPVHRRSAQWLSRISASTRKLHPDFGPSFGEQELPYGIPVTVVTSATSKVTVRFEYADESDRVRYPLSRKTLIEGGWNADGDRHAIILDASTCTLYETWDTHLTASGWYAGSGAVWSLRSNRLRPEGWTSADAAGLPILPGLLRYDEVRAGFVDHAIRFTVPVTSNYYVWPARHRAGATTNLAYPPMGARFRLKSAYSIAGYSKSAQVVLRAMRTYGMVVADNGSAWYFQGTADTRWPIALIDELKRIPASAFEAVDTSPLMIARNSAAARR